MVSLYLQDTVTIFPLDLSCSTVFNHAHIQHSLHSNLLHNLIMYSMETNFCCSFQTSPSHGCSQFFYWKTEEILSSLNCPKDEAGWVIFHSLHSGRGMFLPGEFKGSLVREGFKSAL